MKTSTALQIGVVGSALFVALIAGLASTIMPWWLVLPFFLLFVAVAASWKWPVIALIFVLLAVLGVIPGFSGKINDVLTVSLMLFVILNKWGYIRPLAREYISTWPVLLIFMGWCVFSIIYGYYFRMNFKAYVYSEAADIMHWLFLACTILLMHDEKNANSTMKVIVSVAVILCCLSLAQSLFGLRLTFSGGSRVELLDGAEGGMAGVARSIVPGLPFVEFSYFLALLSISRRSTLRWWWWCILLITLAAIFVSFGRALWAYSFIMSIVTIALVGRKAFFRFFVSLVVGGALLFGTLSIFKPAVIDSVGNRILSVFNEGRSTSSLGWRLTENYFAVPQIESHLFAGLGLGAEYKPRLIDLKLFTEQTHYIHNGYLYVLLKLGVVGLILYGICYYRFLLICFRDFKFRLPEYTPRVAVAAVLMINVLLNFTQPELLSGATIMCLTVLIPLAHKARFSVSSK